MYLNCLGFYFLIQPLTRLPFTFDHVSVLFFLTLFMRRLCAPQNAMFGLHVDLKIPKKLKTKK